MVVHVRSPFLRLTLPFPCAGKCVICDSYVRPSQLARVCDECNYGSYQGRCVICGGAGISDARLLVHAAYCEEMFDLKQMGHSKNLKL